MTKANRFYLPGAAGWIDGSSANQTMRQASSFVLRPSSFVIRHSSFVIRHSSFVIRHSSFVIRHSHPTRQPHDQLPFRRTHFLMESSDPSAARSGRPRPSHPPSRRLGLRPVARRVPMAAGRDRPGYPGHAPLLARRPAAALRRGRQRLVHRPDAKNRPLRLRPPQLPRTAALLRPVPFQVPLRAQPVGVAAADGAGRRADGRLDFPLRALLRPAAVRPGRPGHDVLPGDALLPARRHPRDLARVLPRPGHVGALRAVAGRSQEPALGHRPGAGGHGHDQGNVPHPPGLPRHGRALPLAAGNVPALAPDVPVQPADGPRRKGAGQPRHAVGDRDGPAPRGGRR